MSKILILNGSPRENGNTEGLIKAFTRGAEEAGNTVTEFFLSRMNIRSCLGCYGGGKNADSPCVQKDDMQKIYPVYKQTDVVVLASPLYYWNISGRLKTTFDRLFAVAECDAGYNNPKKQAVLLMAAECDEFEAAEYWYDRLIEHLQWQSLGKVLCGGVLNVGDIAGKKQLTDAENLGKSIK